MTKVLNFIIATFLLLLQGCAESNPKVEDFIGVWKSDDGGTFKFNNNGTFSSENLSGESMFERNEYSGKRYSETGTWGLKNQSGKWTIILSFNNVGNSKGGVGSRLYVIGEKGITSNKPPWYLFKYVGDPDDGVMYTFRKIQI